MHVLSNQSNKSVQDAYFGNCLTVLGQFRIALAMIHGIVANFLLLVERLCCLLLSLIAQPLAVTCIAALIVVVLNKRGVCFCSRSGCGCGGGDHDGCRLHDAQENELNESESNDNTNDERAN